MNKKVIKCIITSLVLIGCLSTISETILADTNFPSNNNLDSSVFYAYNDNVEKSKDDKKDKQKGSTLLKEENYKYLSSSQKRELLELKKYKDKGEELTSEQDITLDSIIDCIIKGKLGNEDYSDFQCLIQKKNSEEKLTDEEDRKLQEYEEIVNGSKLSTKEILNQFLR